MKRNKNGSSRRVRSAKAGLNSSTAEGTTATKPEMQDNGNLSGPGAKSAAEQGVFCGATEIKITPRVKQMLGLAMREAEMLGDSYIGTEHILLAMLKHGELGEMTGCAYRILMAAGITHHVAQFAIRVARVS